MNACVVEKFLHHPLLMRPESGTGPDGHWRCHATVPGLSEYSLVIEPYRAMTMERHKSDGFTQNEYREFVEFSMHKVYRWLLLRRIQIHNPQCYIIDTEQRRMFSVDLVGEWNGRLVLISVYYSRRGRRETWERMSEYMREVARVCRTQYAIDADVVLINAFANHGVRGARIL